MQTVSPPSTADARLFAMFDKHPMWQLVFGEKEFEVAKASSDLWRRAPDDPAWLAPSSPAERYFYLAQKCRARCMDEMDQIQCQPDLLNGGLEEGPLHAYLDRLEARRAANRGTRCSPITEAAKAALRPIVTAAEGAVCQSTADSWNGASALRAYSAICADIRMRVNAISTTTDLSTLLPRHSTTDIPLRLAKILMGLIAEATPAIYRSAANDPGAASFLQSVIHCVNVYTLPGLLRAQSALETPQGQAEEQARLGEYGWGILPQCAGDVLFILHSICLASREFSPRSNPAAESLGVLLAGEYQTLENALELISARTRLRKHEHREQSSRALTNGRVS